MAKVNIYEVLLWFTHSIIMQHWPLMNSAQSDTFSKHCAGLSEMLTTEEKVMGSERQSSTCLSTFIVSIKIQIIKKKFRKYKTISTMRKEKIIKNPTMFFYNSCLIFDTVSYIYFSQWLEIKINASKLWLSMLWPCLPPWNLYLVMSGNTYFT